MIRTLIDLSVHHMFGGRSVEALTVEEHLKLFSFFKDNQIENLVYGEMKPHLEATENQDLIRGWKDYYFLKMISFKERSSIVYKITADLNACDIPYVVLKGPACAVYYPEIIQRRYGDIDILVSGEDMQRAGELLEQLGYRKSSHQGCSYHVDYRHSDFLEVELHQGIDNGEYLLNKEIIEKRLLENSEVRQIGGHRVSIPSQHDNLNYLIYHAVKHISFHGFGVRHLLDLHCLLEEEWIVDWEQVHKDLEIMGLLTAGRYLFTLCNSLFGTKVEQEMLTDEDEVYHLLYSYMMDETSLNGISDKDTYMEDTYARYSDGEHNKVRSVISVLFPSAVKMPGKYLYAKKYPVLLPVAWIHRLVYELIYERKRSVKFIKTKPDVAHVNKKQALLDGMSLGRMYEHND